MQTPYVPRSLTFDLTVEKKSKQRLSTSLDQDNASSNTKAHHNINRDRRISLKNITDQNKMVSFSSPTDNTETMKKIKTIPHRRTKSQLDEENDEDQRKVGIFKKEQTPLTVRKNVKRGRASQGSIVPISDETLGFDSEHVMDPQETEHVFDFKDFDEMLNLSNDDVELSRDIEDDQVDDLSSKNGKDDDSSASDDVLSAKGNLLHRTSDFSSLLSDDNDDSSAVDGYVDADATENQFTLAHDDDDGEGNTNDSISLSEMIKNFNVGYEDHSQVGRKSIESIVDFEDFLGDTDSSVDLLVTPLVPNKGAKWTSNTKTANEAESSEEVTSTKPHSKVPKDINVKSYSDTETSLVISMQHLEDILKTGGEEALDHVLNIAETGSKSPSPAKKVNKDRAFVGLGGKYRRKVDDSVSDDGFSFHSNVEHGHVIHDVCLRSNLKSALIALRSVKAERNDLESNLERMDASVKDLKLKHESELVEKEEAIERIIKERESEKEIMEKKIQSLQFLVDEQAHQHSTQLKEAQSEIEIQREELIRVTKLFHEEKDKCTRMQADVDILRLANEGLQDKTDEVASLNASLDKLDQKVSMLEVAIEVKDEEIRTKDVKLASTESLLEESVRIANNLKLELEGQNSSVDDLKAQLSDMESQMERLRQDSMETINQLDAQLIKAQEELQLVPELKDRVAELANILKEAENELTKQQEQSIQHEQALAETELNLMNVEAEATSLKNELAELQRSDQTTHFEPANMKQYTKDCRLNIEEIKSEVTTTSVSNENIVSVHDKSDESTELSQLLDTCKARISNLESELSSKEREQDELSEALVSAIEEKRAIQEQFDEQCSDIAEYQRQIKDLSQDIERKDRDIERLVQSIQDNSKDDDKSSSSSLPMDIERLRVDLQISEANLEVAKKCLAEKEMEIKDLQKKCEDIQIRHSEELEEKESQIARSKVSLEHSQLELSEKLEEIKSLTNMLHEANTKLSNQTPAHETYVDNLEKMLDGSKKRLELLERENDDQKAAIEHFELMNNNAKELETTKTRLEVQVDELQKKIRNMEDMHKHEIETIQRSPDSKFILEIQEKDAVINDLQRELKLTQLQISQLSQHVAEQKVEHMDTSTQTDLEPSSVEADAKEAISELVLELQAVTMERESVKAKLIDAENKILTIIDSYNHRELEIIALETSLNKAQTLIGVRPFNESDDMRLVIGELVDEIARIRTSAEIFESEKEEIAVDLQYSDETAELEAQRANTAESEVRKVEEFLKSILNDLTDSNIHPKARCHLCIDRLQKWFMKCSDVQKDVLNSFVLSENSHYEEGASNFMDESEDFGETDNRDIVHVGKLFSPSGTEYHDAIDGPSPMTKSKSPLVRYEDYQRLRQKCDMLEAEREELINETFCLLDSSSAANAAEMSALENKLRREAMERVDECTQRLTSYFVDRMERISTIRRWQIEGNSPTKSKSD